MKDGQEFVFNDRSNQQYMQAIHIITIRYYYTLSAEGWRGNSSTFANISMPQTIHRSLRLCLQSVSLVRASLVAMASRSSFLL
jgi:hypothetical protein